MLFSWLKQRRRHRLLAQPFPRNWTAILEKNVKHYRFLLEPEKKKLRDSIKIFVAEKNWEGCGGLKMTDEIKVTIAAMASLLVLGMEHNYFDRVKSILVYPAAYLRPESRDRRTGIVDEAGEAVIGEAWYRGPVVLSWDDASTDSRLRHRGHNVVFHEFAHQLDMLDGVINGTPPLENAEASRRWQEVMTGEFERLARAADRGRATLLDSYGATDEAEFFAVATECFFEQPIELSKRHPELYELLCGYYKQDPAKRCREQDCR
jgi:Mlc titration factor MtfA (ptsG expression regulator)